MTDINEYSRNFTGFEMPRILKQLVEFDNSLPPGEAFSQGFEFGNYEDKLGVKTYSAEPDFYNNLIEFAWATAGGSTYAFWIRNDNKNLEHAPIVVFGGEGGVHVVAVNLLALLQILTFDTEPMVSWDRVYYYKSEDDEPSERHNNYTAWLAKHFGIEKTNNADVIVADAQRKYQEEFRAWMGRYYK